MGIIITNKYYTDYGMEYVCSRLVKEFDRLGQKISVVPDLILKYNEYNYDTIINSDFGIFWNKDVRLAKAIESKKIRLFNNSYALEICDDKEKTLSAIEGQNIRIPKTFVYPLVYDVNNEIDESFLTVVEKELGYPIIVKETIGSQGRQVYLAENYRELKALCQRLLHIPHIYQEFLGEYGCDYRIYVIGGEIAACCKRINTTGFKSNIMSGGTMKLVNLGSKHKEAALNISRLLKLDFGAIDFIAIDEPIFLEANSNAYFRAIEQMGVDIAGRLAKYIIRETK